MLSSFEETGRTKSVDFWELLDRFSTFGNVFISRDGYAYDM
jgi:hypothetical protein